MDSWYWHIIFPLSRWLHIVGTTLLVGGTLFYELIVPVAIEDLKEEQQLTVFNRARWAFRSVVWISICMLVASGSVSLWRLWGGYHDLFIQSRWWALAHVAVGSLAMLIAILLIIRRQPPTHPIGWMRLNLVLLLTAILLAGIARHVRLTIREELRRSPNELSSVNW